MTAQDLKVYLETLAAQDEVVLSWQGKLFELVLAEVQPSDKAVLQLTAEKQRVF